MQPLEPDAASIVREWMEKADADLLVAEGISAASARDLRIREILGFHCQQAVEKYLKALLTRHQVEFPRTHDIAVLLELVAQVDPGLSHALSDCDWLSPFGVRVRYPGDSPEMVPGDEVRALDLARRAGRLVSARLTA